MRPHYQFWPRRLPKSITLPATSLWDNLATNARRYPDKAALVFFGTTVSYRQLMEGAERLAARLAQLGVQRGDRVVLCMQNCPQLVMAHFAILRANAVVVPVNPMNRTDELRHCQQDSGATVAITAQHLLPEFAPLHQPDAPSEPVPGSMLTAALRHLVVATYSDALPTLPALPEPPAPDLVAAPRQPLVGDRKSTRLNSSHAGLSRMPSSA